VYPGRRAAKITTVDIKVRGEVSGLNDEEFQSAVQQSERICPVSKALRNNVEIRVNASLGQ